MSQIICVIPGDAECLICIQSSTWESGLGFPQNEAFVECQR